MSLSHQEFDRAYYFDGLEMRHHRIDRDSLRGQLRVAREASRHANPDYSDGLAAWLRDERVRSLRQQLAFTSERLSAVEQRLRPIRDHLQMTVDPVVVHHGIDASCLHWQHTDGRFALAYSPDGKKATIVVQPSWDSYDSPEVARIVAQSIRHTLEGVGARHLWSVRRHGNRISLSTRQ